MVGLLTVLATGQGIEARNVYFLLIILGISYAGFVLVGLPFVLLLRAKNLLNCWSLLGGSLVAGPMFLLLAEIFLPGALFRGGWDALIVLTSVVPSIFIAMTFAYISGARWNW